MGHPGVILRAETLARRAHQGQVDKAGYPYAEHPAAVASITACRYPGDAEAIATAWLHDVVEGTHVSIEEIRAEFGDSIAAAVAAEHSYVEGNPYKSLHVIARAPSGQVIELQVHSVASQSIKDRLHADYELERDYGRPVSERAAARERMVRAWSEVMPPDGLDGLVLGGAEVVRKRYPNPFLRRAERSDEG